MTIQQALADSRAALTASDIPAAEAAVDVNLFACSLLGWDRARLLAALRETVPDSLTHGLRDWTSRRQHGEPTAYIVGSREFWGLDIAVSPAVLIPRPESEFIVEESLALLSGVSAPRLADIGTGSGCLAVALATERDDCRVVATDLARDALVVAGQNARTFGVDHRVRFVQASYLDGVSQTFDLIMANPPYVRDGDAVALSRAVLREPSVALFGGPTGLRNLAGTLDAALASLRPGGWLVMEFGYGQEDALRALAKARPALSLNRIREDLQGISRTAILSHDASH